MHFTFSIQNKYYKWHKVQTIRTMHSLIPCTVTSQCGTPLKEWKSLAIRTSKTFHIPMYHTIKGMEINSSPHLKNIPHPEHSTPHRTQKTLSAGRLYLIKSLKSNLENY